MHVLHRLVELTLFVTRALARAILVTTAIQRLNVDRSALGTKIVISKWLASIINVSIRAKTPVV